MKIFYSFIFIVTLVNASNLQSSSLLLTTLQQAVHSPQESQEQAPARTQYHNQGSEGFYSYGYSGETSAKAEYKSVDGSSKGFYSYVDSDGKLQTVEYVAGREQGFKAAVSNLPRAPVDNRQGPAQVRDTPEVQMAKKAHFEAFREAELRAALASSEHQSAGVTETDSNNGLYDLNREQDNMLERNRHEQQQQLLLMMAKSNPHENLMSNQKQLETNLNDEARAESEARLMASYNFNNDGASNVELPQSYTLAQASSSVNSHGVSAQARTLTVLQPTHLGNVQLDLPSYHATLQPTTSYSISPNELTTLSDPATFATLHGEQLPTTTYLTH